MLKNVKNTSKGTKLILFASFIIVALLVLTPTLFFDLPQGVIAIWGVEAIFGGTAREAYKITTSFSWRLYINCLLILLAGFTTYYIAPRARGYYIFGAILFALTTVFTAASQAWLVGVSIASSNPSVLGAACYWGIGPVFGSILSLVAAITCIIEYKTFKLR